jgi:hypothetical protein
VRGIRFNEWLRSEIIIFGYLTHTVYCKYQVCHVRNQNCYRARIRPPPIDQGKSWPVVVHARHLDWRCARSVLWFLLKIFNYPSGPRPSLNPHKIPACAHSWTLLYCPLLIFSWFCCHSHGSTDILISLSWCYWNSHGSTDIFLALLAFSWFCWYSHLIIMILLPFLWF